MTQTVQNLEWNEATRCTAFEGSQRIASGQLREVAALIREWSDRHGSGALVLIFDDMTGKQIELDLRGSADEVVARLPKAEAAASEGDSPTEPDAPRGPGRPRLGVVAREVTLLPRHWEWLSAQPGGASVALRKLVEAARRAGADAERKRQAQEAAYRFATAMAGNCPGYEEAMRALFAGDLPAFEKQTDAWPPDVRDHARQLGCLAMRD
jgi:uncharacterized protein